jgi:hypothetical protein
MKYIYMEIRQRETRESHSFNNRVMYLEDVKNILLTDTQNKGIELTYTHFMNHPALLHKHEKFTAYLHYLIMFSTPKNVHSLLLEHDSLYGPYATQMLINYPFVCSISKNIITPLMCAALWSNDPQMVRVLSYWGADFSQMDVNGKYPEEKYASHYVNHLNHLLAPNHFIIGLRTSRDFVDILREIRILCGMVEKPIGWTHPRMGYRPRSSLGTSVLSSSPPQSNSSTWSRGGSSLTNTIPEESSTNQANEHA